MRLKNLFFLGLGVLPGLLAPATSRAQSPELTMEIYASNMMALTNSQLNKAMLNETIRRSKARSGERGAASTAPAAAAGATAVAAPYLRYTTTTAMRRTTAEAFARRQPGTTSATVTKFAAMFGPGGPADYEPLYAKLLPGTGLQNNNVADAFAACLVATYRVAHGEVPGGALLPAGPTAAVRQQFAPTAARVLAGRPASVAAQLGELLKLQTVLVSVGAQGTDAAKAAAFRRNVATRFQQLFKVDVNALTLTEQGLVKSAGPAATVAPAAPAGARAAASPAPATAGAGVAAGAQWFFRARSDAYGGLSFEPVALLANGQYCDVGEEPLESLNPAADRARRPDAWGTWRKNGNSFVLTDAKGRPNSYALGTGSWFPAYAAGAVPLKRTYKNASGGSVGGATSLVISKLNFVDASHFTEGANGGVMTANAAGGSRRSAGGTYRLQGHTLTLTYPDGRTVRKSFAIGAKGTPARPADNLIFIGGDAYTGE
ncbi:hypothetical protein [Hymenobacter sp. BT559]|uniref:hypothetical protein n=1 Tax=Hymenobacter sp. BT559 TaxID=2795729 RepID=UPI0018EB2240|nr:hypothetical protein [Hymenobacter sp. BT559]MBJ6144866.1 hypothetical protein [Hymenobacter sp. BT559]